MPERSDLILHAHARRRVRQRGFTQSALAALFALGDHLVPVGGGCTALTASGRCLAEARAEGLPPSLLDRLRDRAMVLDDSGRVVTVMPLRGKARRKYIRASSGRRDAGRRRHHRG